MAKKEKIVKPDAIEEKKAEEQNEKKQKTNKEANTLAARKFGRFNNKG